MSELRERAQAYLEVANNATPGPWEVEEGTTEKDPTDYIVAPDDVAVVRVFKRMDGTMRGNAQFIAASRTEGVWAAQKLLEALDVLEKYMTCDDCNSKGYTLQRVKEKRGWRTIEDVVKITCKRCGIARQFLEGRHR